MAATSATLGDAYNGDSYTGYVHHKKQGHTMIIDHEGK